MNGRTARLLRRTADDRSLTYLGKPVTRKMLKTTWNAASKKERARFRRRLWRAPSKRIGRRWLRLAMSLAGVSS